MFYHFLYPLKDIFFGFNVFRYITFRAAFAAVSAFLISVLFGPLIIKLLSRHNISQNVMREECPALHPLHKQKQGTPTMGGILILVAIVVSTLLWANLSNKYVLLALASTVWLGIIGFADDFIKVARGRAGGLSALTKLSGQLILGVVVGWILFTDPNITHRLDIPFFKNLIINLGVFYVPFVILVLVSTSNAVNLTDGLDGLAIGCTIMIALTYGVLSYVTGHLKFSDYLNIIYIPGSGELAVFCAALLGAGLGFLWFNAYPASIFMGDTGSLAIGGAIGLVSVLIKKELILIIVGGIFVAEALSVILQVGSFKLKQRRLFLMTPIHHHFQLRGWAEPKIIVRFWIIAAILALLSLSTLKLR